MVEIKDKKKNSEYKFKIYKEDWLEVLKSCTVLIGSILANGVGCAKKIL